MMNVIKKESRSGRSRCLHLKFPAESLVFHIDGRWSPVRVRTRLKERKAGRDKGPLPVVPVTAQGDHCMGTAGAPKSRKHAEPGAHCERGSGQDGSEQQYIRSRPAYPGLATRDLRRRRTWRHFPEPRRFSCGGLWRSSAPDFATKLHIGEYR